MKVLNASDVRSDWGNFIDSVVREKPKFIKRSRDLTFMSSLDALETMLVAYTFNAQLYVENDKSVTLSLEEIDIVVNGENEDKALLVLAEDILEYAEDYYSEFNYWASAPNRKAHLPYVLKVLIQQDIEKIKSLITVKRQGV